MANTYYSYQDIILKPNYSKFLSRDDVNVSTQFGPRQFQMPVVPANMTCVINSELARWMSANDYFYIMHRFNVDHTHPANKDNREFLQMANEENWKTISISVGVKEEDREFLKFVAENKYRVDYITIDIAHAHSIRMKEMLEFVRGITFDAKLKAIHPSGLTAEVVLPHQPFIIAGNVATPEAVRDLEDWGADCVKVGIAQGDACTTYGQTGFGVPMFSCMLECAAVATRPIIADGGIRMNGDFAKALVAGGSMVMAGSIFAACIDSPAESVVHLDHDNAVSKRYYGSASEHNKGSHRHIEGRMVELPCNGMTYVEKLEEVKGALQSSFSYSGGDIYGVDWGIIHK